MIKENIRRIEESNDEEEKIKLMNFNNELNEEKMMLSQNGKSQVE